MNVKQARFAAVTAARAEKRSAAFLPDAEEPQEPTPAQVADLVHDVAIAVRALANAMLNGEKKQGAE